MKKLSTPRLERSQTLHTGLVTLLFQNREHLRERWCVCAFVLELRDAIGVERIESIQK